METIPTKNSLIPFHLVVTCVVFLHATTVYGAAFDTNSTTSSRRDRISLLAFKGQMSDPHGALASWSNHRLHFCKWVGVSCTNSASSNNTRKLRVTVLDLQGSGLEGTLSPHLGNLTFLEVLNLRGNQLHGEIPEELGNLQFLTKLDLSRNAFGGHVPTNISNCLQLEILNLGFNHLEGTISPVLLTSLMKLKILILGHNKLTGTIPLSVGNLTSLTGLSLRGNALVGGIPEAVGLIAGLQSLVLSENNLSGKLPLSLHNLSSLSVLSVASNNLHGSLPSNLVLDLPNIKSLEVGGNDFMGSIPTSISNATHWHTLDFSDNHFSGYVPTDMGNLSELYCLNFEGNQLGGSLNFLSSLRNSPRLHHLSIANNAFEGEVPHHIGSLSPNLSLLYLWGNNLNGTIPQEIETLVGLTDLQLQGNSFIGTIPASIGNLQNLHVLNLSMNNLSGQIPSSLGNLTRLTKLSLQKNQLTESLPGTLGDCRSLLSLDVSHNNLTGVIPPQLMRMPSLTISLNLNYNFFTGSLPIEVGQLKRLSKLDISDNRLSGEIPWSIVHCENMRYLLMGRNLFQGTISTKISEMKAIQELDISHNNLSGLIPKDLAKLSITFLDLSYNNLYGEVPKHGVFGNASAFSVLGNKRLCGGIPELHLPQCPPTQISSKKSRKIYLIVIPMASVIVVLALVGALLWYVRRLKKGNPPVSTSEKGHYMRKISYHELHKATDGFALSNLIGVGSYGSVYKGMMLNNEKEQVVIAVKVLNLHHKGGSKSFLAECEALKNIRHRNLVKILTSCSSIDSYGSEFKALVYDYVANGSLEMWLHPEVDGGQRRHPSISEVISLSIIQKLDIAIDVASAMDYLHHRCQYPIVHCDIKPSNVLLDDDMTARVGDFGMAKILSEDVNRNETSMSSVAIKGTIGFVPPEYGMGCKVSSKGDVYSYGILLLEMFTGIKPTDKMFGDGSTNNLHDYVVRRCFPGLVMENTDTDVRLERRDPRSSCMIEEHFLSVLKIALSCSTEFPKDRPEMRDVLTRLQALKTSLVHGVGECENQTVPIS